jgi:hypothetical protein
MELPSKSGHGAKPKTHLDRDQYQANRSMLIFTKADASTIGFPLSWLYRFDYRKDGHGEVLTLHLTEHLVTVVGRMLGMAVGQLQQGEGFHLSEVPERYQGLQRNQDVHVASITIEPMTKPNHDNN